MKLIKFYFFVISVVQPQSPRKKNRLSLHLNTERQKDRKTERQRDTERGKETERQRETERQKDKKTERQRDRQTSKT